MTKWEYKIVKAGHAMPGSEAQNFPVLGLNGWELISVVQEPRGYWWFYFKRPVAEQPDDGLPTIGEAFQVARHAQQGRKLLFEDIHPKTGEKLRVFSQGGQLVVDTPSDSCWLSPDQARDMAMAMLASLAVEGSVKPPVEPPLEEAGP